jgi:hypothetical protein
VCDASSGCQEGVCVEGATSECGEITATGVCTNDVLQYCAGGALFTVDCGESNQVCDFDMEANWYDCVEPSISVSDGPLGGACGLITDKGYCLNNVLTSCPGGNPISIDCTSEDLYCAYQPSQKVFGCGVTPGCISSCPEGTRCQIDGICGCDGVDYVGQCEGETLAYCDGDGVVTLDCAGIGMACGYNGSIFLCVDVGE